MFEFIKKLFKKEKPTQEIVDFSKYIFRDKYMFGYDSYDYGMNDEEKKRIQEIFRRD